MMKCIEDELIEHLKKNAPKEIQTDPKRLADYLKGASDVLAIWQRIFEDDLK